ncbi:MAG: hypothetical protein ACLP01_26500 [Solirubrobacteraceae bacterium]
MSRVLDVQPPVGSLWRVLLTEPRRPLLVRESPRAHWYVVGTVCIGAFMGQLDASIVTLALARLGHDLHASVGAVALWHGTAGLLGGLALTGLGLGAFTPANNATIMSASPPGHAGVISGVLNMTRGMGTALGVALAGALYTAAVGPSGVGGARAAEAHGLSVTLMTLSVLALAVGLALFCTHRHSDWGGVQR